MTLDLTKYDAGFDPPSASADDLAKARAAGALAERQRIAAIVNGPQGRNDLRAAINTALSGATPTQASDAPKATGAADWGDIAAELNAEAGFAKPGASKTEKPAQAGAADWGDIASELGRETEGKRI